MRNTLHIKTFQRLGCENYIFSFSNQKQNICVTLKIIIFPLFFRLVLRCRSRARKQFAALRSDVLVKLELLDNKHFQDMVFQLKRLLEGLAKFHIQTQEIVSQEKLFPIEVDWIPPSVNAAGDQFE